MIFADYWKALMEKNPGLAVDEAIKMTLPIASFRKALEQAFEQGREQQKATDNVMGKLFDGLRGGK